MLPLLFFLGTCYQFLKRTSYPGFSCHFHLCSDLTCLYSLVSLSSLPPSSSPLFVSGFRYRLWQKIKNVWHNPRRPLLTPFAEKISWRQLPPCWSRWLWCANEPTFEILALFVLRKFILQIRMRRHPVRLDVWFLVWPFVYFHSSCVRTAKALARLRGCAGTPKPSLVAYAISTIISWAGSNEHLNIKSEQIMPFISSAVCILWNNSQLTIEFDISWKQ